MLVPPIPTKMDQDGFAQHQVEHLYPLPNEQYILMLNALYSCSYPIAWMIVKVMAMRISQHCLNTQIYSKVGVYYIPTLTWSHINEDYEF